MLSAVTEYYSYLSMNLKPYQMIINWCGEDKAYLVEVPEAAERLGLSLAIVRRSCAEGKLPTHKIGRDGAIRRRDGKRFASISRSVNYLLEEFTASSKPTGDVIFGLFVPGAGKYLLGGTELHKGAGAVLVDHHEGGEI